jgi:hypothetical protein
VVPRALAPVFMFCAPGLIFGDTEGVGTHFHVLRSRTHFRRYRGCSVPFSCLSLPDSFSAVPSVLGPVFIFCASGLVFGGTEGVESRFHVLCSRTHFRRCRGRSILFSCFVFSGSFSTVSRASAPVFMFRAPGHNFDGTEGVGTYFHVFCARTHFRRYRGCPVPFSCLSLPDSFSAVPSVLGPVFMFCASGLIFGGTETVGSHFHVVRSRTHFRRCRGRPVPFSYFWRYSERCVPFSCFALPDTFSAV